jgi:hypothetical protein
MVLFHLWVLVTPLFGLGCGFRIAPPEQSLVTFRSERPVMWPCFLFYMSVLSQVVFLTLFSTRCAILTIDQCNFMSHWKLTFVVHCTGGASEVKLTAFLTLLLESDKLSTSLGIVGVKRTGREADNSPESNAEVPHTSSWCGVQLSTAYAIMAQDNFAHLPLQCGPE